MVSAEFIRIRMCVSFLSAHQFSSDCSYVFRWISYFCEFKRTSSCRQVKCREDKRLMWWWWNVFSELGSFLQLWIFSNRAAPYTSITRAHWSSRLETVFFSVNCQRVLQMWQSSKTIKINWQAACREQQLLLYLLSWWWLWIRSQKMVLNTCIGSLPISPTSIWLLLQVNSTNVLL